MGLGFEVRASGLRFRVEVCGLGLKVLRQRCRVWG